MYKMPSKAETPRTTSYRPELDVTPELDPVMEEYYTMSMGDEVAVPPHPSP